MLFECMPHLLRKSVGENTMISSYRWSGWFVDTCVLCCKLLPCRQSAHRDTEVIDGETLTVTNYVSICAQCAPKAQSYSFEKCSCCGQYRLCEKTNNNGAICNKCKTRLGTINIPTDLGTGRVPGHTPGVGCGS